MGMVPCCYSLDAGQPAGLTIQLVGRYPWPFWKNLTTATIRVIVQAILAREYR